MATHHCIGNPCWICYPELNPWKGHSKVNIEELYSIPIAPVTVSPIVSNALKDLLIDIFDYGLGEDCHYWLTGDDKSRNQLSIDEIKRERFNIPNDSLEAILIDKMLEDFGVKNESVSSLSEDT